MEALKIPPLTLGDKSYRGDSRCMRKKHLLTNTKM